MDNIETISIFKQVAEFQGKILKNPVKDRPVDEMSNQYKNNTIVFISEELQELNVAFNADNKPEVLDALIDLIYFAAGAIHNLGVDGDEAFKRVHRANMAKHAGVKPTRGLDGDATKPEAWTAPEFDDMFK